MVVTIDFGNTSGGSVTKDIRVVTDTFGNDVHGIDVPDLIRKALVQQAAEAVVETISSHLGPFVTAVETTRMAMIFTNAAVPDHPIIFANDSFLRLTGYSRAEVVGQSFNFLMARGTSPAALTEIEDAFGDESCEAPEVLYHRKDGTTFWTGIEISPVRDAEGVVQQHFASFIDLTKHKQEQVDSRAMIGELNHRVKNTLVTVQSIVRQALRNDNDLDAIRRAVEARLFALARSHDLLTRTNWRGTGLFDLVREAVSSFTPNQNTISRIAINGPNICISPNSALALGITIHELATNAVKYGSLSNETGRIAMEWAVEPAAEGDRLHLRWQELGGPQILPPSRRGFGLRMIERGLASELHGVVQLSFPAGGLVCSIDVPVPLFQGDRQNAFVQA